MHGRTIQIFLPDGNPRGIKIADITSRTIQAIQIPRSKLNDAADRIEVKSVGIYFLFGTQANDSTPMAYIGEAENCHKRLLQHNRNKDTNKDFWDNAVVFTSKILSFNKAHGKYLEWQCIDSAKKTNRFTLNQVSPSKPHVSESMEADLAENIDAIRILLSTLGYPILEPLKATTRANEIFYCKRTKYSGEGEFLDDGFLVYKGSKARIKASDAAPPWIVNMRKKLVMSGVLKEDNGYLVFQSNHLFNSPSSAAATIFGIQSNGWTEWKNKNGKTLDELKRK